jgi:hypothetical protein
MTEHEGEGDQCRSARVNGKTKEAWVVDYVDADGKRRLKTFKRKRDADAFNNTVASEVRAGTHTADRASTTVAKAGELWLTACERRNLERSSLARNRRHVKRHIATYFTALDIAKAKAHQSVNAPAGRAIF